jgi:hypothetical protein
MEKEIDKVYIGKVEAFEIMLERNIETLPRKGKQWLSVLSCLEASHTRIIAHILGKDEDGFYIAKLVQGV